MKIILVHMHFNDPEKGGPLRSYYLASEMVSGGIACEVVTAHNQSKYVLKEVEGIKVHYLPVAYDNAFGFMKRVYAFLKFNKLAARLISRLERPDMLYVMSTPLTTGILAMKLKKNLKLPYIFEVGDLWPEAPVQMGVIRNSLLKKWLYRLEANVYKRARKVVALSPPIGDYVEEIVGTEKVTVITNMADTHYFKKGHAKEGIQEINKDKLFTVASIGAMGKANQLDFMLEGARYFADNKIPARFLLMGWGAETSRLKEKAAGIDNVQFIPFGNREEVRKVLVTVDALYISYKDIPVLETGCPNKLFDALAAGKLVIVNFGGWIARLLEHNQCGFQVDPRDPADLFRKLAPYFDPSRMEEASNNARQLAGLYSREVQGEKLVHLLKETL